jgi:hypothetical protein
MATDQRPEGGFSCSFCGKTQREVRKLIAGPEVYICDECIRLCNDIIFDEENGPWLQQFIATARHLSELCASQELPLEIRASAQELTSLLAYRPTETQGT